jgi:hypothetical protein
LFGSQFSVNTTELHGLAPSNCWATSDVDRFLRSPDCRQEGNGNEDYKYLWEWKAPLATSTGKPCEICKEGSLCRYHKHKLAH